MPKTKKYSFADTICNIIAIAYTVHLGYLATLGRDSPLITLTVLFVVWNIANFFNYSLIHPLLKPLTVLKPTKNDK